MGLAAGFSALIATCMVVVPNYDRIQFFERFRLAELSGTAQKAVSDLMTIAGLIDDQPEGIESLEGVVNIGLAE